MKRLALLFILLAVACLGPRVEAAPPQGSYAHLLRTILRTQVAIGSHHFHLLPASLHPEAASGSSVHQSTSFLRLPDAAFSPATIKIDGTADNTIADKNPFRQNHSQNYEAFNRLDGYYQRADWQPSGSTDAVEFRYQASIFRDAASAQSAWNDGITYTQQVTGISSVSCATNDVPACSAIAYGLKDGRTVAYLASQFQQYLIEVSASYTDALYTAQSNQINTTLATMSATGDALAKDGPGNNNPPTSAPPTSAPPTLTPPTKVPPPTAAPVSTAVPQPTQPPATDFRLVALHVEKYGAPPNPAQSSLGRVKRGTRVQIAAYIDVRDAPVNANLSADWKIMSRGHAVLTKTMRGTLGANPIGKIRVLLLLQGMKKTGTYMASVRITISDRSASGATSFKVQNKGTTPSTPSCCL